MVKDLSQYRIGLKSLTEIIDTLTSSGKLIFHIFAILTDFERSIVRERTLEEMGDEPVQWEQVLLIPPVYLLGGGHSQALILLR